MRVFELLLELLLELCCLDVFYYFIVLAMNLYYVLLWYCLLLLYAYNNLGLWVRVWVWGMGSMRLWSHGGLGLVRSCCGVGEEFVEFFCPRSFSIEQYMVVRMDASHVN